MTSPMSQAPPQRERLFGFDGEDNEVADFVDDRAQVVAARAPRRFAQLLRALARPLSPIEEGADVDRLAVYGWCTRLRPAADTLQQLVQGRGADPFGMFNFAGDAARAPHASRRRLTRLQSLALEAMALDDNADATAIRARYAELVKRWHPDANGGDRGAEANLQRVLKAYQTLKAAGLV